MGTSVIRQTLKEIPSSSGVYLFKGKNGKIIYVGKSKNLKIRIRDYLRPVFVKTGYDNKTARMIEGIKSLDFIVTSNEKEALFLEGILIRKYKPLYNIVLQSGTKYVYFKFSEQEEYSSLSLVRQIVEDGSCYYGPFENFLVARKIFNWIRKIFPLRSCSNYKFKKRSNPCFNYEIGFCSAPCVGKIDKKRYQYLKGQVKRFFLGHNKYLLRTILKQMKKASFERRFEDAIILRDRWKSLTKFFEEQNVIKIKKYNIDAIVLSRAKNENQVSVLSMRGGLVISSRSYRFENVLGTSSTIMYQILLMLYQRGEILPPLLLVSHLPDNLPLILEFFKKINSGVKVEICKPKKGEKFAILALAKKNVNRNMLNLGIEKNKKVLNQLLLSLKLKKYPYRVECVDVSHLNGKFIVGSVAVMIGGKLDKKSCFSCEILEKGKYSDIGAIFEVLKYRFNKNKCKPDLLLIDGGKGHLNSIFGFLKKCFVNDSFELAAIAKGRKGTIDKVFVLGIQNQIDFNMRDASLLFLMRLRDEAHRLSICYHRQLRNKNLFFANIE